VLAEHGDTEQDRDCRVDVGDHGRACRPDLRDQREEDDERRGGAHDGQTGHRRDHLAADMRRPRQRGRRRPHDRRQRKRGKRDADRRKVGKPAAEDQRPRRVTNRDQQYAADRETVDILDLEADQRRDAREAESQPEQPRPVEDFSRAHQPRYQHPEQGHGRNQQTSERTGHVLFGRRQQPPGQRHLDDGEQQQRTPSAEDVDKSAAPRRDRQ